MIETIGLGAGSYPMAPEKDESEKQITLYLEVKTTDIFPETWDKEQIQEYIKTNAYDYIQNGEIKINEIEV